MKITKKRLMEMVDNLITKNMVDMGDENDSKMNPSTHVFLTRGEPSPELSSSVKSIIDELEDGGAVLANDKEATIHKIIMDIKKAITEQF